MNKAMTELTGYASDNEETAQLENIIESLNRYEEKLKSAKNDLKSNEELLHNLKSLADKVSQGQFEAESDRMMEEILEMSDNLDEVSKRNSKKLSDLKVDMTKKELRFKEFDVAVKYKKREKECDTGRLLVKKVKNRSSKLLKKVLEKSDLILSEENT